MPDGDRFERALRGSWRFPYRIAAAGASAERVAEQLATACLSLVTDDVRSCSRKMMTALDGLSFTTQCRCSSENRKTRRFNV